MYVKITKSETIYPYSLKKLRDDNKNISFPTNPSKELLAKFNVYKVKSKPVKQVDDYRKDVIETNPIILDSEYVQNFEIVDADDFTINKRLEQQWGEIRDIRNKLLSESDWTQLRDTPIREPQLGQWQDYRQKLRDITSQPNPFNINWPTKPQ